MLFKFWFLFIWAKTRILLLSLFISLFSDSILLYFGIIFILVFKRWNWHNWLILIFYLALTLANKTSILMWFIWIISIIISCILIFKCYFLFFTFYCHIPYTRLYTTFRTLRYLLIFIIFFNQLWCIIHQLF